MYNIAIKKLIEIVERYKIDVLRPKSKWPYFAFSLF